MEDVEGGSKMSGEFNDRTELVAEDRCDVCGEWSDIVFCDCGAELCERCFAGHVHSGSHDRGDT